MSGTPFRVTRSWGDLEVKVIPGVAYDEHTLILEEHRCPSSSAFGALGLSAREGEMMEWLLKGKTNGDICGISHRTVQKHFENIFRKLGVETRTAAIALIHTYLQS